MQKSNLAVWEPTLILWRSFRNLAKVFILAILAVSLGCGADSVRFRPALTVSHDEIDTAVDAVRAALREMSVRLG